MNTLLLCQDLTVVWEPPTSPEMALGTEEL